MSTSAGASDGHKKRTRGANDEKVARRDHTRDRDDVVGREKEKFGGMKFGAAFFGWLTAVGTAVLLLALAAAIAAAIGASMGGAEQAGSAVNLQAAGIWGAIIVLVVWFIAYFCGGYVAGRMARFSGVKQGIAVWLWAIIIAIIIAIIGLIVGPNVMSSIGGMPSIPVDPSQMTVGAIISLVVLLLVTLGGAILGGIAGMRYHRKVDRAGFED